IAEFRTFRHGWAHSSRGRKASQPTSVESFVAMPTNSRRLSTERSPLSGGLAHCTRSFDHRHCCVIWTAERGTSPSSCFTPENGVEKKDSHLWGFSNQIATTDHGFTNSNWADNEHSCFDQTPVPPECHT